jgi:hypothetical protein
MPNADAQQRRPPYNATTLNQAGPEASSSDGALRATSPPPPTDIPVEKRNSYNKPGRD